MPRILVTNDDGVHSEGIQALAEALAPLGEVTIVAPIQEASAIGHALTLRRPLRLETIRPDVYAVDGTPTDCVNVAIAHVLHGKPDLIVSGHQQRVEPRRRRDVLGDRVGRARRRAARYSEHRGLDAEPAQRVRLPAGGASGRHGGRGGARARHAEVHAAQHQRAVRAQQGISCDGTGASAITSRW